MNKIDRKKYPNPKDEGPYGYWYQCPRCDGGQVFATYRYCPDCGLEIEWIGEEPDD